MSKEKGDAVKSTVMWGCFAHGYKKSLPLKSVSGRHRCPKCAPWMNLMMFPLSSNPQFDYSTGAVLFLFGLYFLWKALLHTVGLLWPWVSQLEQDHSDLHIWRVNGCLCVCFLSTPKSNNSLCLQPAKIASFKSLQRTININELAELRFKCYSCKQNLIN